MKAHLIVMTVVNFHSALAGLRARSVACVLTCGGAAVLRILREGHGSLHAVLLHLLDGVLRQRLHVAEADVELVRGCREGERPSGGGGGT